MIAVTFALPQESQDLVRALTARVIAGAPHLPILGGQLGSHSVVIGHTGVGADSTQLRLRELLARHRPRVLISAGFAGGLDPKLQVADLVIAVNFTEPKFLEVARSSGAGRGDYFGALTSQAAVAATAESKAQLGRQTGALAIDMETATIAEFCRQENVPMFSVRSISDAVGEALPVPFSVWFDPQKQKPRVLALLVYLARHPGKIGPFVRFVQGISRARARLTDYLLELIPTL